MGGARTSSGEGTGCCEASTDFRPAAAETGTAVAVAAAAGAGTIGAGGALAGAAGAATIGGGAEISFAFLSACNADQWLTIRANFVRIG